MFEKKPTGCFDKKSRMLFLKMPLQKNGIYKIKSYRNQTFFFLLFCVALAGGTAPLLAQVSLWNDQNIYSEQFKAGDVVKILVREKFSLKVSGKWGRQIDVELSVTPDRNNLPFLPESELSKSNSRKSKEDQKVSENFEFEIAGTLGVIEGAPQGLFAVEARKQITLDGKVSAMALSGFIDPKMIQKRTVQSSDIVNLAINVRTAPPLERDGSIDAEAAGDEGKGDQFRWRDADKERLLLNHIREIVGGMR